MADTTIGTLRMMLTANAEGFVGGLRSAERSMGAFTVRMENAAVSAGKFALGMAGIGTVAGVVRTVTESMREFGGLKGPAESLGMSIEKFQALRLVAGYGSEKIALMESSLQGLNKKLGEAAFNGGEAADALKAIGLDAATLASGGTASAFEKIARALSEIRSPQSRIALAADIFGRGNEELAQFLDDIPDKLRKIREEAGDGNLILSDKEIKGLAKANETIDKWWFKVKAVAGKFAADIIENGPLGSSIMTKAGLERLTQENNPLLWQQLYGKVLPEFEAKLPGAKGAADWELDFAPLKKESDKMTVEAREATSALASLRSMLDSWKLGVRDRLMETIEKGKHPLEVKEAIDILAQLRAQDKAKRDAEVLEDLADRAREALERKIELQEKAAKKESDWLDLARTEGEKSLEAAAEWAKAVKTGVMGPGVFRELMMQEEEKYRTQKQSLELAPAMAPGSLEAASAVAMHYAEIVPPMQRSAAAAEKTAEGQKQIVDKLDRILKEVTGMGADVH
jgi:flagellar biosynthesis GTPase FlhF